MSHIMGMNRCNKRRTRKILFFCFVFVALGIFRMVVHQLTYTGSITKPCTLEDLDPWDPALKPFLVKPEPLVCSERVPIMYVNDTGFLNFNTSALALNSLSTVSCVYMAVKRVDGDVEVVFEHARPMQLPVFVPAHVYRVQCQKNNQSLPVYDYLHINPFWNDTRKQEQDVADESPDNLSIIMFGIDSVSRSHALRNLPKSFKFLQEEFDAYDFKGYSKVGENTWPNLVPLFTGQSYRRFPLVLTGRHCDSMPLAWYEASAKNTVTFFAEDRPDISTFNFVKSGFRYAPTDAYFRPYTLAMNKFRPLINEPLNMANWDCFGSSNYFDLQVEYLKGFLLRYRRKRKLAYFWSNQVGHERFDTLSRGDAPLLIFLKWLKLEHILKNSLFVLFSDHGYRIGGASLTHVGRAENNKPLFLLHVPKHIKDKYPWIHKTLSLNTQRLVSHYDTYQTVLDLLNRKHLDSIKSEPVSSSLVRRNLFAEIPYLRSCADAGIEDKYCTCEEKIEIDPNTPLIKKMADFIVASINAILLKQQDICENLRVHDITEATVSYSKSDEDNVAAGPKKGIFSFLQSENSDTGRYVILIHTSPGNAYFEGTVDYADVSWEGKSNEMTLVGEPSRLDRYGNQSHCVDNSFLKLYCYCKGFRER